MSALAEQLADCDTRDIRLQPDGDGGLTVDAPQGALTPDLVDQLKAHKVDLLAILRTDVDHPNIDPTDATVVWQAALDRLEGDPLFSTDMMEAMRTADVRWTDEPETDDASEADDTITPSDLRAKQS